MRMNKLLYCIGSVAFSVAIVACGNNGSEKTEKVGQTTPVGQSQSAAEAPMTASTAIGGKVLETMDASGYTYVKLDDGSGEELWAAGPKADLKVGEEVTLQGGSVMNNFNSKTLDKTFEKIIFASGFVRGGAEMAEGGASFASAVQAEGGIGSDTVSGGSGGAVVAFADLKIDKATGENAKSVSEVFAQAADLDTKKVSVQGQVVKVSKNIMGKNWLHLQDGTGDPISNTHDLVVTTAGEAEKGAIVTIEGLCVANKDFGSGYKYDVIIEEAVVK